MKELEVKRQLAVVCPESNRPRLITECEKCDAYGGVEENALDFSLKCNIDEMG